MSLWNLSPYFKSPNDSNDIYICCHSIRDFLLINPTTFTPMKQIWLEFQARKPGSFLSPEKRKLNLYRSLQYFLKSVLALLKTEVTSHHKLSRSKHSFQKGNSLGASHFFRLDQMISFTHSSSSICEDRRRNPHHMIENNWKYEYVEYIYIYKNIYRDTHPK